MKIDAGELKEKLTGRWLSVIQSLDSRFSGMETKKHYPCPVHGGRDGFRLFDNVEDTGGAVCNTCGVFTDGLALLQWSSGQDFRETLIRVNDLVSDGTARPAPQVTKTIEPNTGKQRAIRKQLERSDTTINLPASEYFKFRGLPPVQEYPSIRYVDGIPFYHEGKPLLKPDGSWQTYPAIIGVMRSAEGIAGITQTFITKTGQRVTDDLKSRGIDSNGKRYLNYLPLSGSAIRLGVPDECLGVCEGLETALALREMTDNQLPIAAATSAALLRAIDIPERVKRVIIFADRDRSKAGEVAASALAERLAEQGKVVVVKLPPMNIHAGQKSADWLNYLIAQRNACNNPVVEW